MPNGSDLNFTAMLERWRANQSAYMVGVNAADEAQQLLDRLRGLLSKVKVSHCDSTGYLVHKSDPTQQVLEFDESCPACVLRALEQIIGSGKGGVKNG
jgi:hypothetical protein